MAPLRSLVLFRALPCRGLQLLARTSWLRVSGACVRADADSARYTLTTVSGVKLCFTGIGKQKHRLAKFGLSTCKAASAQADE